MKKHKLFLQKVVFIIIFPLLGSLLLLFAFVRIFFIAQRKERTTKIKGELQHDLFSISTFDGRTMYQEIIKATKDFDQIYCIGKGGHGRVEEALKKLHQSEPPGGALPIIHGSKPHPSSTQYNVLFEFLRSSFLSTSST